MEELRDAEGLEAQGEKHGTAASGQASVNTIRVLDEELKRNPVKIYSCKCMKSLMGAHHSLIREGVQDQTGSQEHERLDFGDVVDRVWELIVALWLLGLDKEVDVDDEVSQDVAS